MSEATGQDLLQQTLAEATTRVPGPPHLGTSTVLLAFLYGIGPLAPKQRMGGRKQGAK